MTTLLHTALDELFDWIIMHKASILDGMTRREQRDFTDALGKARTALGDREGISQARPDRIVRRDPVEAGKRLAERFRPSLEILARGADPTLSAPSTPFTIAQALWIEYQRAGERRPPFAPMEVQAARTMIRNCAKRLGVDAEFVAWERGDNDAAAQVAAERTPLQPGEELVWTFLLENGRPAVGLCRHDRRILEGYAHQGERIVALAVRMLGEDTISPPPLMPDRETMISVMETVDLGSGDWTLADYREACAEAILASVPPAHPDDMAIDRFALAMKAKMARGRAKGRGGWDDPAQCRVEDLAEMLREHIGKGNAGNFEDIANLAMMLHARGADPAILAGTPDPASVGQRLLRAADEALAIARGEAEPARVHVPCEGKVDHGGESDAMITAGLTMEAKDELAALIREELGGALCNDFAAADLAETLCARFEMRPRAQAEKENE